VAREGDFELRAFERGGRLCMSLRRSSHYRGQACGRIPRSPHRPVHMFPDIGFNNYVAAVPPSVRVAEVESRSGRRGRHRTFAARGFFSRFVLIPAPPVAVFVRFYGADGTLLGVDGGQAGYIGFDTETQVFGDPGSGVEAHTEPLLTPRPGDPGRLSTIGCVFAETSLGGSGFCDWRADLGFVLLSECSEHDLAGALPAADVAGLRLTLGSGTELTLAPGDLPAPFGGRAQRGRDDHRRQRPRAPTPRGAPPRAGRAGRPQRRDGAPDRASAVPDPVRRGPTAGSGLLHRPRSRHADRPPVPALQRDGHGAMRAAAGARLRPHGDRFATPVVRLAGGRTVRAQRIRLRGEDAFVAFLPDTRVRGLRSGRHRVALDLPPASSQCGYSADRAF
jgi:hypothetical protein